MNTPELIEDYLIDRNEGMKNVITWFLNQVMQQEALNQIQALPYERTDQRRARRNGIRKRSLKTLHGKIILDKPQFREVPFRTQVFDRYSRVEKSLRIAVAESYLQGVSTRKVQEVVSKFGLENISASEVSRIAKDLDEKVKSRNSWKDRLKEKLTTCFWMQAISKSDLKVDIKTRRCLLLLAFMKTDIERY